MSLDRAAVDAALRKVIEFADYDLHKGIECDEETGEDTYAEHVDRFITEYGKALAPPVIAAGGTADSGRNPTYGWRTDER